MLFLKATLFLVLFHQSKNVLGVDNRKFPSNFKFGAASAAFQVEGAWDEDGKGENIWDHLIHEQPDRVIDHSTADISADTYHHVDTDIGLLKDLGVDHYRFSISWPRILPTGYLEDGINEAGVEYYNNLFDKLKENGIGTIVTLYHWDLPQKLHEDFGGWLNETIVQTYTDYARVAFELFGDRVQYWSTFNEPWVVCYFGYEAGQAAPLKTDNPGIDPYQCAHNILKTHAAAYHLYNDEFKKSQNGKVGIILNSEWFEPASEDDSDVEASERRLLFTYGWFANPLVYGDYPQLMIDRIADRSAKEGFENSRLPQFTDEEKDYIKGSYDFLGLNHYTTTTVSAGEESEIGTPSWEKDLSITVGKQQQIIGWGLRKLINWIKDAYGNPDLIITESGTWDISDSLDDQNRIDYYREYLSSLLEAIHDDGANVIAYTTWSLMDDFEWFYGYLIKFGLYRVDFNDPERTRTPKASVEYYKSILATKCLIDECVEN